MCSQLFIGAGCGLIFVRDDVVNVNLARARRVGYNELHEGFDWLGKAMKKNAMKHVGYRCGMLMAKIQKQKKVALALKKKADSEEIATPKAEVEPVTAEPAAVAAEPEAKAAEPKAKAAPMVASLTIGQKVRCTVEDIMHKLRHGFNGKVSTVSGVLCTVDFDTTIAPVSIPLKLLTPIPDKGFKRASPLTGLVRMSVTDKIDLLRDAGIEDPRESDVALANQKHELLSDQSIDITTGVLRSNMNVTDDGKVFYVHTFFSCRLIEDQTGKAVGCHYHEGPQDVKDRRLRLFRKWFESCTLMLMPIYSGKGSPHWTLLAVKKVEADIQVSYYDSLELMHKGCQANAKMLLKLLKLDGTLTRVNASRQTDVECGFFVCHYIEDHLRAYKGEGHATQKWPNSRMSVLKNNVKTWCKTLERVRLTWCKNELADEMKEAARMKQVAEAARVSLESKGLLVELAEAHAKLAASCMKAGEASSGIPFPEGFCEKPPKAKVTDGAETPSTPVIPPLPTALVAEIMQQPVQPVDQQTQHNGCPAHENPVETCGDCRKICEDKDRLADAAAAAAPIEKPKLTSLLDLHTKAEDDVKPHDKAKPDEPEDDVKPTGLPDEPEKPEVQPDGSEDVSTPDEPKEPEVKPDKLDDVVELLVEPGKAEGTEGDDKKLKAASDALKSKEASKNELKLTREEEITVQMCIDVWTVDELSESFKTKFLKVKAEGLGLCTKCRMESGCLRCHDVKAWSYYVKQELGLYGIRVKKPKASAKKKA